MPLLDLLLLKKGSPVALNLPQEIQDMREEYRIREGLPEVPVKSNSKRRRQGAKKTDQNALNDATNGLQRDLLVDDTRQQHNEVHYINSRSDTCSSDARIEGRSEAEIQSPTIDTCLLQKTVNLTTIELANCCLTSDTAKPLSQDEMTSKSDLVSEYSKENSSETTSSCISDDKVEVEATLSNPDPTAASSNSQMDSRSEDDEGLGNSGPGFRVTCNR